MTAKGFLTRNGIAVHQTDEDRRQVLQDALTAKFGGAAGGVFLVSVDSGAGFVVYEHFNGTADPSQLFQTTFTMSDDGKVEFGEPVRVMRETRFVPVASNSKPEGEPPAKPRSPLTNEEIERQMVEYQRKQGGFPAYNILVGDPGTSVLDDPEAVKQAAQNARPYGYVQSICVDDD